MPIHSFEPGGVERVGLRLAKKWQAEGDDVTVVLGRDRGRCRAQAPDLDYRTLAEPFSTDRWETIWMIWSLFQFLLVNKVDAIFCAGNTYTVVCVAMKLLLGRRCPPVLVKISNDLDRRDLPPPARPFYRAWLHIQGAMLDHFVALAPPMRRELEDGLKITRDLVSVIPDPALSDLDLAKYEAIAADRKRGNACRFLSVGRLSSQKNQALIVEAFARHAWPGDTLVIAGEGPDRRRLEALIARHGLADRVSLAGHVDDVGALMAEADVFVLSSDYEGVPAVILEALAAGLPIATTDCCASMDWLTGHGRFGVTCPVGDAEALGAAMNLARHLPPERAAMKALAQRFTLERSAALYRADFERLKTSHARQLLQNLRCCVWDWPGRGV